MKVKARDLVAGWPRGRSFIVLPSGRQKAPPTSPHLVDELVLEVYRAEQQRMVTAWLERHRRPPADSKMRSLATWEVHCLEQLRIRPIAGL